VLAATSARDAAKVQAALREAPGACGAGTGNEDDWLSSLQRIVSEHQGQLSWRAIHLAHETEGVVAL
jgi:hypothetical protein